MIPEQVWGALAGAAVTAMVGIVMSLIARNAAHRDLRLQKIEVRAEAAATSEEVKGVSEQLTAHTERDNNLFDSIRTHIEAVEVRLRGEVRDSKIDILTVLREPSQVQARTGAAARRRSRKPSQPDPEAGQPGSANP